MLDRDILPWIAARRPASDVERHRASTIVADRLCGSISDPIVRNAQEKRQLALIANYLKKKGYRQQSPAGRSPAWSRARSRLGTGLVAHRGAELAGNCR